MDPISSKKKSNVKSGWWFEPLWKILVSWDDEIPNISGKIKLMFQTTNQVMFTKCATLFLGIFHPWTPGRRHRPTFSYRALRRASSAWWRVSWTYKGRQQMALSIGRRIWKTWWVNMNVLFITNQSSPHMLVIIYGSPSTVADRNSQLRSPPTRHRNVYCFNFHVSCSNHREVSSMFPKEFHPLDPECMQQTLIGHTIW